VIRKLKGRAVLNIEIKSVIGDGRFADIFSGVDEIGREVAVKVLREEGKGVSNLLNHARALVRSKHKNVVEIYSIESLEIPNVGIEECIIMELINGMTLAERLTLPLSNKVAYQLGHEILEGVIHIHNQGLTHMDLHDENVLIEDNGNVKIIDIMYISSLILASEKIQSSRLEYDKAQLISILERICEKSAYGRAAKEDFINNIDISSTLLDIKHSFENIFTLIHFNLNYDYIVDSLKINPIKVRCYKFRSECEIDVNNLVNLMGRDIISIKKSKDYFPDSDVELVTGLTLREIKDYISQVQDGHVMYETIALHYLYTGERDYSYEITVDTQELKFSSRVLKNMQMFFNKLLVTFNLDKLK